MRIVSSVTYVDERAGEHLFSNCAERLERVIGGSPSSTGWIDVECQLGVLAAGNHTLTVGGYNNLKTSSNEFTYIYIDDVIVEGEEGAAALLEAHFDSNAESFVYIDDAFATSQPSYAVLSGFSTGP